MNRSQQTLRELSDDPNKAIRFMKNLNWLIAVANHNVFLIIVSYMMGICTALGVYVWLIK